MTFLNHEIFKLEGCQRNSGEILTYCHRILDSIDSIHVPDYTDLLGDSVQVIDRADLLDLSIDLIAKETDSTVIAYRNANVDKYTFNLRKRLYPEKYELLVNEGERLISNSYTQTFTYEILEDMSGETCKEYDRESGTIRKSFYTGEAIQAKDIIFATDETYELNWFYIETMFGVIRTIHKSSVKEWKLILKDAYKEAKKTRNWYRYNFIESTNANVAYGYAITTHKAQGSTYDTVIVDLNDICQQRKDITLRNKMLYVACSRAANKLYIIEA